MVWVPIRTCPSLVWLLQLVLVMLLVVNVAVWGRWFACLAVPPSHHLLLVALLLRRGHSQWCLSWPLLLALLVVMLLLRKGPRPTPGGPTKHWECNGSKRGGEGLQVMDCCSGWQGVLQGLGWHPPA